MSCELADWRLLAGHFLCWFDLGLCLLLVVLFAVGFVGLLVSYCVVNSVVVMCCVFMCFNGFGCSGCWAACVAFCYV